LSEKTKYDLFMEELISLEKRVLLLLQRSEETLAQKEALEKKVKILEDENEMLKLKLEEIRDSENVLNNNGLDESEREALKEKIDSLIEKIDYHMRS
jgi:predicted RNase H-like nuclease (RuvC/YqgF family)